ncbi:UNVERIFIED_CONTAM: hypothetical protein O8I53_06540 [Campylobacter lari]
MKAKKIFFNSLSIISPITAFSVVSCGQTVSSPEKIAQDKFFSSASNVETVENI